MEFESVRSDLRVVTQQQDLAAGDTFGLVLQRLDAFAEGPDIPERFHHYLTRRSYIKALEWLDNPEMPHKR